MMIKGSCGCGMIQFELTEAPLMMGTCHCSKCRKAGASTFVLVKKETFRWISGSQHLSKYDADPEVDHVRTFCSKCGSSLGGDPGTQEPVFPIAANGLDGDPVVRNRFHEFVANKPVWYEICDGAKQFLEHPVLS